MDSPIVIPGCPDSMCPFDIFEIIAESLIPDNWNELCGLSNTQKKRRTTSPLYNEELLDDSNLFTAYFC